MAYPSEAAAAAVVVGSDQCGSALDSDLGWALGAVFRVYVKSAEAAVADLPGGPRGYQVLAAAAQDLPGSQLALAQQLGIDRSVLTYLLDDLEHGKLIERRPDPADRRARSIVLTRTGEATLARFGKRLAAAEQHALRGLDEREQRVLRDLLWRASAVGAREQSACDVVAEVAGSL